MKTIAHKSASDPLPVTFERIEDGIAHVILQRPEARNAVNPALAAELEACVTAIERDPAVAIAILSGSGDQAFCAGADLRVVADGRLDDCFTPAGGFAGFVNARRTKPWIAAVRGAALAGGFEIVLACDLVIAADDARFGLPEVRRGLIASAGGLYRLPRIVPRVVAMEMITTGRPINAAEALGYGLVNRVVPSHDILAEAIKLAREVRANAPLAVRESVRIARIASGFDDAVLRSDAEQSQSSLQQTSDYMEGAVAFLEKRAPRWRGR